MTSTNPKIPDAPIPGANYTSDTRNYPWHRPPDLHSTDDILEYAMKQLTETDSGMVYMSLIESGVTITAITDIILTLGISKGKFSIDFAVLSAGPIARLLEILAKSYDIKYDLGIDTEPNFVSSVVFKEAMALSNGEVAEEEEVPESTESEEPEGFMAPVSEEEQSNMLGYNTEELDEDE